jgi:hypothetical protein
MAQWKSALANRIEGIADEFRAGSRVFQSQKKNLN